MFCVGMGYPDDEMRIKTRHFMRTSKPRDDLTTLACYEEYKP
jgi:hypothetical protein